MILNESKTFKIGEKFKGMFLSFGKVSAQPYTIVKTNLFPNGNVLFFSLFSLVKNWMHNLVWGCAEILPSASLISGQLHINVKL